MNKITVIGIPYDKKSSTLRGPSKAPPLIRKCLHSGISNYYSENGVTIENDQIGDMGDFDIDEYFDIEKIGRQSINDHSRLFTLGGDHSITYPLLRALSGTYYDISVLHIDAHADLYDEYGGDRYSHACPFARIMEDGLASRLLQVGIRTLNDHQREQSARFGTEIIEMKDFQLNKIPRLTGNVYLSIDMDGIDPGFAPGVSHQEPGGLSPRDVISIINGIKGTIIGADLVEFNPLLDSNGITASLAVKLMKEILGKMLTS
ncbi:MAG TPA: agmatinase [Bacteroidales bacterium]|nr:agmatinase [Bacteroidales bacterium]